MSPAKGEKLIEVKGLEKHFKHVEVLRGINIDICKGDVVAVIGPSGSGKSTFLRCLNLLEEPTGGQIVFEGVDITSKETKIDQMRQKIGMVFQQFNLFTNMTVLDNVSAGPVLVKGMKKDEARKLAQSLLERVGLGDRGGAYPIQLSGGQQRGVVREAVLRLGDAHGQAAKAARVQLRKLLFCGGGKRHVRRAVYVFAYRADLVRHGRVVRIGEAHRTFFQNAQHILGQLQAARSAFCKHLAQRAGHAPWQRPQRRRARCRTGGT